MVRNVAEFIDAEKIFKVVDMDDVPALEASRETARVVKHGFMYWTLDTSHEYSGWSKLSVSANMNAMSWTEEVSHRLNGWLKAVAPWNMPLILVTKEMSQLIIDWLKAVAPWNM